MNRRDFTRTMGGAALAASFPYHLLAAATSRTAQDRITLGPRKIPLSRLAMGTGSNGWGRKSNQTRKLGLDGLAAHLQAAYDNGVTFWDSADQYGTHPHLAQALKNGVPRDKVTIMSKSTSPTYEGMKADIDRFRKELNTDYIDILLLHCMTDGDWNVKRKGAMDAITEAQEKGIVKTRGVSCHTLDALKTAAAEPWVEVDLARINPDQVQMDAPPDTVIGLLKQMKASGKGVIGMKIFGAGKLRDQQDRCLQYTLALDCIDCFTIGTESREQFDDLVKRIPAASTRG